MGLLTDKEEGGFMKRVEGASPLDNFGSDIIVSVVEWRMALGTNCLIAFKINYLHWLVPSNERSHAFGRWGGRRERDKMLIFALSPLNVHPHFVERVNKLHWEKLWIRWLTEWLRGWSRSCLVAGWLGTPCLVALIVFGWGKCNL